MIKIARKMRFKPHLLMDSDAIRESIRSSRVRAPEPEAPEGAYIDCSARRPSQTPVPQDVIG